jgi:glycosyltransferase involved in cell wall biosynthesis
MKMSNPDYPLVSIGIPLYNEARFVAASLSSILAQDYPYLEIIISDNASKDGTLGICQKVLGSRTNVIIHQFENNRGASENFRYVLSAAKGKYFMWVSGHDLWASNIVSESVALLEATPTAVIAFGSSVWIDEDGHQLPKLSGYTDTRGMSPISRFFTVFFGNMHPILGIIRKSAIDLAQPICSAVGADLILLSELALQGDFVHVTGTQWKRREFRHESNHAEKLKRYRSSDYGLTHSLIGRYLPLLRLPLELVRNVIHSDLRPLEKVAIALALVASLPVRYIAGKQRTTIEKATQRKCPA